MGTHKVEYLIHNLDTILYNEENLNLRIQRNQKIWHNLNHIFLKVEVKTSQSFSKKFKLTWIFQNF